MTDDHVFCVNVPLIMLGKQLGCSLCGWGNVNRIWNRDIWKYPNWPSMPMKVTDIWEWSQDPPDRAQKQAQGIWVVRAHGLLGEHCLPTSFGNLSY